MVWYDSPARLSVKIFIPFAQIFVHLPVYIYFRWVSRKYIIFYKMEETSETKKRKIDDTKDV